MLKKALSFILAEIIALIGTLALIILYYSNKRKFINLDKIQDSLKSNKPIIFVSWHGRLVLMPFQRPKGQKVTAIVSRHFDGEVISKLIRNFGNSSIRGSTNRTKDIQKGSKNRGGSTVLRRSTKILENGENLAITPDICPV
jgi:lysophospholipid acyltransferase (LPLAT)-like uncharacterized protein